MLLIVRTDVLKSGFLLSEKSKFEPSQRAPFLGFILGLSDGYMYVTQKRLDKFCSNISRSTVFHKFDQSPRPCEDCWVTYLDEPSTRPNCSPAIPLHISRHQWHAHIDAPVDLKTHRGRLR